MKFSLKDQVVVITGGAGLLGEKHAEAVAEIGGIPILIDINEELVKEKSENIIGKFSVQSEGVKVDITSAEEIEEFTKIIISRFQKIDVLINNAANNPTMVDSSEIEWSRLENFSIKRWNDDLAVGLTGAFLCSKVIGSKMAERHKGVIVNIASDLGIIAPDQRLYMKEGLPEDKQPCKPITYSIVKHGIIGLTKYLATYWCDKGIRVNSLSPGGVYTNQPEEFVNKLTNLIPMGRMAKPVEYKGAIQFLCSDASSYMTGANLVVDGGRTCW